ncbi:MAG: peptidylprolyl isomerase, partial [Rikenellaceae bacterium]
MASLVGCSESQRNTSATIVTSAGSISVVLYNDTPLHKANFIEMVNAGTYEGMLFHRVIDYFVIQAGDPTSKDAEPGAPLGEASAGEEVT